MSVSVDLQIAESRAFFVTKFSFSGGIHEDLRRRRLHCACCDDTTDRLPQRILFGEAPRSTAQKATCPCQWPADGGSRCAGSVTVPYSVQKNR